MSKLAIGGLSWILAASLALGFASSVLAQDASSPSDLNGEDLSEWGRASRKKAPPTDAGRWDGTWFYVNRDTRMALWIRTVDGVPQVKFRYMSTSSKEGFETDWDGNSEYQLPKASGSFALNMSHRDASKIQGHWEWKLERGAAARIEEGDYDIYRTGDGRFLVVNFPKYTRTMVGTSGKKRVYVGYPSWTFQKISKRLVLWDELPF